MERKWKAIVLALVWYKSAFALFHDVVNFPFDFFLRSTIPPYFFKEKSLLPGLPPSTPILLRCSYRNVPN